MNDQSSIPEDTATAAAETIRFAYVTRDGLLKLTVVNFLLSVVTLSIYRFWAKTNVRKHIWSCVHLNGEPLEYTGTGKELFLGALVVFCFLILPFVLISAGISFAYGPEHPAIFMLQMVLVFIIYVFWGYAVYKARKYQLSRTNWRGIRGSLSGSAMTYSLLYFGSLLAKSMSFGWATPVMNTVLQEQIVNDMRFGDAAFKFKGRAGPLYPTYALCWLLTFAGLFILPLVLGISLAGSGWFEWFDKVFSPEGGDVSSGGWVAIVAIILFLFILLSVIIPMLWAIYTARELRVFANYTRFDGAQFRLAATWGSVVWLTIVNALIIILTLGIGWPYVNQRTVRFVIDRLSLEGAIDIDRIAQSSIALDKRGEGLADAFDVGGL
jgi:uncharacterized membrane protein YjgN (DUF898 family)